MRRSRRPWRAATSAAMLLTCVVGAVLVGAQARTLRLVSTDWPPFTGPAGQPRLALDLVETALERAGHPSTTTIVEAGAYPAMLLTGDVDGSAAAWTDAERQRVLLFSEPYLENRLVLVGRKGADVSATSLASLAGRRLALVEGYAYGEQVEGSGPVFVRVKNEQESLARLLDGTVDFALMDDLVVQYMVEHHARDAQARLQFGATPLVTRPLHLAIRRTVPDAQGIIDRFNGQLRGMITDRTYHKLLGVDWIAADVDGDGQFEYVPESDRAGPTAPKRAYSIRTLQDDGTFTPQPAESTQPRFYLGGNIYRSWASVPSQYKMPGNMPPHPSRSTASLFRFAW